ncbi:MAG: SGNH/GDSL hydrolase family protein [Bacteroidota bacterium]|nr:SGNH/GDSL hydrolase family protein [Bacteroidota bacterium]
MKSLSAKFVWTVLNLVIISFLSTGCNLNNPDDTGQTTPDYGKLIIHPISNLTVGDSIRISPVFSNYNYKAAVQYSFEGTDISIENGIVKALVANKTVTVTASTIYQTAQFTVSTVPDYSILSPGNVYTWTGYPASEFYLAMPDDSSPVTYDYDKSKLVLNATTKTVHALVAGKFEVKASSGNQTTSFNVVCNTVDKTGSKWDVSPYSDYAEVMHHLWISAGHDGKTTLFIGDSFFDTRWFWTDFYTKFEGKDALCCGISSTTTFDWETFAVSFLADTDPKNLVVNIGTNNVYDDGEDAETVTEDLQRLFTLLHGKLANTAIYYFSIAQRNDANTDRKEIVSLINNAMQKWCEHKTWITFLDVEHKLTTNMLRDGVHPQLQYYSVYMNALTATNIQMVNR